MADKKISALTAATTPLDGTEVLPIVQSGATVKATNNDLRPKQIQSNATSGVLQVVGPAASSTRVMTTPNANFTVARTDAAQSFSGAQTFGDGAKIGGAEALKFWTYTNTVTAGQVSDGYADITITAVTLAKVRALTYAIQFAVNGLVYFPSSARVDFLTLSSTTNVRITFGASIAANDVVSITIIESQ